ncbi:MAG: leucine-rich repeat domain-containing protein [Prevotella sp.]|nr:leucine-rich repeat domain-containing protein [Prevotella sp.]
MALDFSEITIADNLFSFQSVSNRKKITSVVMPNGLTTLADGAFNGCTSLNNVGWSTALTSIGEEAFYNTGFTSITIPEGVKTIGEQAFAFCGSLGSITFPATLETVGKDVIEKSPVLALYSRNPTPPEALGDFCTAEDPAAYNSAYNWNFGNNEFDFYSHCILYVEPNEDVLEAYANAPYWKKFFIKGMVKIYLRPTDLQRPQVSGVQQLEVTSPNVNDGYTTTCTINTVYVRSMDVSKWYTIMLPFAVSYEKLKEVFGEGTQVWGYSGVYDNTLCFDEPVTVAGEGMEADIPYLIKPGVAKGEYEFNGEDVSYTPFNASPSLAVAGGQKGTEQYTSTYQGTYTNQKIPTYAYYLKNNRFYYMPGENASLGWKAYGGIVYVSDESNVDPGTNVSVFDLAVGHSGDASVIESYQMETKASDHPLYNLAGQQVRQPKRGIYVRNGKKIIIK